MTNWNDTASIGVCSVDSEEGYGGSTGCCCGSGAGRRHQNASERGMLGAPGCRPGMCRSSGQRWMVPHRSLLSAPLAGLHSPSTLLSDYTTLTRDFSSLGILRAVTVTRCVLVVSRPHSAHVDSGSLMIRLLAGAFCHCRPSHGHRSALRRGTCEWYNAQKKVK